MAADRFTGEFFEAVHQQLVIMLADRLRIGKAGGDRHQYEQVFMAFRGYRWIGDRRAANVKERRSRPFLFLVYLLGMQPEILVKETGCDVLAWQCACRPRGKTAGRKAQMSALPNSYLCNAGLPGIAMHARYAGNRRCRRSRESARNGWQYEYTSRGPPDVSSRSTVSAVRNCTPACLAIV